MKILIIDDESHIRNSICKLLSFEEIESVSAPSAEDGQKLLQTDFFDALVLDLRLPGISGLDFLKWMDTEGFKIPVLMISAHGEIRDAVEALKLGAKDYLVKPFDPDELIFKIRGIVTNQKHERMLEINKRTFFTSPGLIGNSESIRKLRKQISQLGKTPSNVLITGESGTGKEVAAREIHRISFDNDEPFIAVNIGAIPEQLVESELFGHEKGAFTGADSRKHGLFELTGNGTLFLDEIGEMAMPLQVKLLRVLQEHTFRRVGGTKDLFFRGRILSATNKNLEKLITQGKFREDLFYRLNVVPICLPPLRERLEDVPLLAEFLLQKISRKLGIGGISFSDEAVKKLCRYHYPGNVRELENIIERALIYRRDEVITKEEITLPVSIPDADDLGDNNPTLPEPRNEIRPMKALEKETIINTLRKWDGNRTKAAEELGISRRTIINKIKRYDITE